MNTHPAYVTVSGTAAAEIAVKKSRFLGHLASAASEAQARSVLESVRKEHYNARHTCWAYILRDGGKRFSDDGEPQGTAGLPILGVLEKNGLQDCVLTVTRYFGGILLGAPGLVRAYTESASQTIQAAAVIRMAWCGTYTIPCPYELYGKIAGVVQNAGAEILDTLYGAEVTLSVRIPQENAAQLCAVLTEATNGKAVAVPCGEGYCAS
ncbi:MAG: IMPACT family protein [Oscillospiraceae bacterium]|jgi:uncharacterized YigZ family protein|nr:IMPACT family protein [Oscillospiraceae bacterium]